MYFIKLCFFEETRYHDFKPEHLRGTLCRFFQLLTSRKFWFEVFIQIHLFHETFVSIQRLKQQAKTGEKSWWFGETPVQSKQVIKGLKKNCMLERNARPFRT